MGILEEHHGLGHFRAQRLRYLFLVLQQTRHVDLARAWSAEVTVLDPLHVLELTLSD